MKGTKKLSRRNVPKNNKNDVMNKLSEKFDGNKIRIRFCQHYSNKTEAAKQAATQLVTAERDRETACEFVRKNFI